MSNEITVHTNYGYDSAGKKFSIGGKIDSSFGNTNPLGNPDKLIAFTNAMMGAAEAAKNAPPPQSQPSASPQPGLSYDSKTGMVNGIPDGSFQRPTVNPNPAIGPSGSNYADIGGPVYPGPYGGLQQGAPKPTQGIISDGGPMLRGTQSLKKEPEDPVGRRGYGRNMRTYG